MTQVVTPLIHAEAVLDSIRRSDAHATSEYAGLGPDSVMATVSRPETLVWSDTLTWAICHIDESGAPFPVVASDREAIKEHYDLMHGSGRRDSKYSVIARLGSPWWTMWHVDWVGTLSGIPSKSDEYVSTENLTLLLTDGKGGISGEIAWLRAWLKSPERPSTRADRSRTLTEYLDAIGSGDVDRILRLFSPDEFIYAAVRPYFDHSEGAYPLLDSLAKLRAHYERFYAGATVAEVEVTNSYVAEWFVFVEARWHLTLGDGSQRAMLTVEVMPLGSDGRFVGRTGYGTALEPEPRT